MLFAEKLPLHTLTPVPQLMPEGWLVIKPLLGAVRVRAKVFGGGVTVVPKVAEQFFAASSTTVAVGLVAALAQSPPQLVKVAPVSGVAVKTTEVPVFKLLVQVVPQSMPVG
jgi:hypothetical protein